MPCSWTYHHLLNHHLLIAKLGGAYGFQEDVVSFMKSHHLLIAKLGGAYGFQEDAVSFMKSYLTKRQQRVCVNSKFSTWERIIF